MALVTVGSERAGFITYSDTFSVAGNSAALTIYGGYSFSISGAYTGAIKLEVSNDGGSTWVNKSFVDGTAMSYTGPLANDGMSIVDVQFIPAGKLRVNGSGILSGAPAWVVSQRTPDL